jgi:hypothetical protein
MKRPRGRGCGCCDGQGLGEHPGYLDLSGGGHAEDVSGRGPSRPGAGRGLRR